MLTRRRAPVSFLLFLFFLSLFPPHTTAQPYPVEQDGRWGYIDAGGSVVVGRIAAVITVSGIVLNRFNVTFIAFNWNIPPDQRYVPTVWEIWVTLAFITFAVVVFRWIASRMPIMYEHPEWKDSH